MAAIAARAGAPIGSLYRFFPSKEILADALAERFWALMDGAFRTIKAQARTAPLEVLAEALLSVMVSLRGEQPAIRALLEARSDRSEIRARFRQSVLRHVAQTLRLRRPTLAAAAAESAAVVILHNMKAAGAIEDGLSGRPRAAALGELREMTTLYLRAKLQARAARRRPAPSA
jgi:AcrR family transcriptional regulator